MPAAPTRPVLRRRADADADRAALPALPAQPGAVPVSGVCTMLASGLSTQLGAAIGSLAFPVLGPVGVVAVRQCVAAVVLLAVGRPRLRSFTRRQ